MRAMWSYGDRHHNEKGGFQTMRLHTMITTGALVLAPSVGAGCAVDFACLLNQMPLSGHVHECPRPDPGEAPGAQWAFPGDPGIV